MFTSAVHAQSSDDERAQGHFRAASSYFDQADYESAAREFEAAYRLSARPMLLLNIAMAHERLGAFSAAADTLDRYLDARPDAPDAATVRLRRDNLRARVSVQASTNDEPRGTESEPTTSDERPAPAPQSRRGLGGLGVTGIVTLGVGVAGSVAGIVTTTRAGALEDELVELCGTDGACPPGTQGRIDRGQRLDRASAALYAVGGAMVVGGAVLLIVDLVGGDSSDERASAAPRVVAGPGQAGLGLSWRLR